MPGDLCIAPVSSHYHPYNWLTDVTDLTLGVSARCLELVTPPPAFLAAAHSSIENRHGDVTDNPSDSVVIMGSYMYYKLDGIIVGGIATGEVSFIIVFCVMKFRPIRCTRGVIN